MAWRTVGVVAWFCAVFLVADAAPAAEAEAVALLVKREMERAYPLDVPLVAEVHWGSNWDQAH